MAAFEHVTALLSFVYALALTHLLARAAELVIVRERVGFSGLLTVAMINALTLVFANWFRFGIFVRDRSRYSGPVARR